MKERDLLNKIKVILKMASDLGKDLIIPSDQCLEIINEIEELEMSRAEDARKMAESDKGLADVVARLLEARDNGPQSTALTMADEGEKSRRARECENHAWQFRELEQQMTMQRNESHIPNNPGYLMLLACLIEEYAMSGLIKRETFDTIRAALKKDQGTTLD